MPGSRRSSDLDAGPLVGSAHLGRPHPLARAMDLGRARAGGRGCAPCARGRPLVAAVVREARAVYGRRAQGGVPHMRALTSKPYRC